MPPRLAPGLRVVRRGRGHLQVGSLPGRQVVLPRTPPVLAALERLLAGDPLSTHDADVLARLDDAGCLRSAGATGPASPPQVAVLGRLGVDHVPVLRAGGLAVTDDASPTTPVLVLSLGELDRGRLDPLVRRGTDHLVVRLVDGGAVVGPLVVPGSTACLRCLDAHELVRDPHHVEVISRYVRATAAARGDGVPDLDPALAQLALAWAVRDLAAHLDGRPAGTRSGTWTLGPDAAPPVHTAWRRHPDCGCSWPDLQALSGKMEA